MKKIILGITAGIFLLWIFFDFDRDLNIKSVPDIAVLEKELKCADKDSLVIFDCDEVLITFKDKILKAHNRFYLKLWFLLHHFSLDNKLKEDMFSTVCLQAKTGHVNSKMPSIVKSLQDQGIKTLVLTAIVSGKRGKIDNMMTWRLNSLRDFGYHFEKGWEDVESMKFDNLLKSKMNPEYKDGVIISCFAGKALALKEFFIRTKYQPKKIFFIDDNRKNLKEVGKLAKESGIDYVGIHYTESKNISSLAIKESFYQLNNLKNSLNWLSDDEVHKLSNLS